jgi:hypothetical protein
MFYTISPDTFSTPPNPLPPKTDSTNPLVIATTTVLLFLAVSSCILRLWIRTPRLLGYDDLTIVIAATFSIACYALTVRLAVITGGHHTVYVGADALLTESKISFVFVTIWIWSVTTIKISVCFMLLRIKEYSQRWLVGLWTMIVGLFALASAITICNMLMCRPIKANWDLHYLTTPGYCWSIQKFIHFTYFYSSE